MEEGGGVGGAGGGGQVGGGGGGGGLGGDVRSEKSNDSAQFIHARAVLANNPRSLFSLKSCKVRELSTFVFCFYHC